MTNELQIHSLTLDGYRNFLRLTLQYCDQGSLVVRMSDGKYPERDKFLKKMEPYLLQVGEVREWPGTKLLDGSATLFSFRWNQQCMQLILENSINLESWLEPNLPEDLCLYRTNGEVFLTSISHEKDFFVTAPEEILEKIKNEIFGL